MLKKIGLLVIVLIVLASGVAVAAFSISPSEINQTLTEQYDKYKSLSEGKNADYIPELAKVDPNYFSIVIVTVDGKIYSVGNDNVPFAIESISKLFIYALALEDNGEKALSDRVGLNATGLPFNSIKALDDREGHLQNPLVNAGAILNTSLIKGKDSDDKWMRLLTLMRKASDGKPYLGVPVYQSEMATNQRNHALANLMHSYGMLSGDINDIIGRYTKACSVMVTAKQLGIMGATLANNGVNPVTGETVISSHYVRDILSEMVVNGLYENSGAWWFAVGLPAKSGVGGGILAIVPGKMAIAVFSPPVDVSGNSVRAQKVILDLAEKWKLHLLGE